MITVTESVCQRGTRIQGTKGELIGDMTTFVSCHLPLACFKLLTNLQNVFDFLTRQTKHYAPKLEGGYHGGGDIGLARAFVSAVAEKEQDVLQVTIDDILDSHLLVFAAERARKEGCVVDFTKFKQNSMASSV